MASGGIMLKAFTAISILRRSKTSASAPAKRPRVRAGITWKMPVKPTSSADSERS